MKLSRTGGYESRGLGGTGVTVTTIPTPERLLSTRLGCYGRAPETELKLITATRRH